ncbi:hypothetical protein MtrunA17_Chr4g0012211 [Medicago truncatula]|uniref:Nodule-specific cysteine-rich peptide 335 n=1 Tax=Medicago truncatula TaxID=3880 RepID=A7KHG5_MEDTR|nr:nodule-specific cysteine-rich peptide 335 [Medicago truncatula]RHN59341.1 hypothetical protein MtrunA17_Chr4g0012211 [Medicago truncatula]
MQIGKNMVETPKLDYVIIFFFLYFFFRQMIILRLNTTFRPLNFKMLRFWGQNRNIMKHRGQKVHFSLILSDCKTNKDCPKLRRANVRCRKSYCVPI